MSEPLLEVKSLKTNFGRKTVHDSLDFTLYKGEIVALLGQSGCGKSTLLRMIVGLERPDGGHCLFGDHDLFDRSKESQMAIRRNIAYSFQNGALFDSLTVFENLEFPLRQNGRIRRKEIKRRIADVLESLDLTGTEALYPGDLSGGMQKRIGVARAVMLNPQIILYDEPSAGLDPLNTRLMCELILKLRTKGSTSVVVTHDRDCLEMVADRIIFLADGKVKWMQSRAEFEKNPVPQLVSYLKGEEILLGKNSEKVERHETRKS